MCAVSKNKQIIEVSPIILLFYHKYDLWGKYVRFPTESAVIPVIFGRGADYCIT